MARNSPKSAGSSLGHVEFLTRVLGDMRFVRYLAVGLAVAALVFFVLERQHQDQQRRAFEQRAHRIAAIRSSALRASLEGVQGLAGLFSNSTQVNQAEFESFARAARRRNPSLYALLWAPRVAHRDKDRFVAALTILSKYSTSAS